MIETFKRECVFCGSTDNIPVFKIGMVEKSAPMVIKKVCICHVCLNQAYICEDGLTISEKQSRRY